MVFGKCEASSTCASHSALMNGFAASSPPATISSVGAVLPRLHQIPGLLGRLGLDHHDRDVTVGQHPAGHDHVEGRVLELVDVGEADPLITDQGDADAADRPAERQPSQLGGHRRGVDRDHVVDLVGVQRHHGDDDLDLVPQALDEAGPQRPVDQPAGEDRALGRAALAPEERAGDPPGGVHPLLDVDGQREEVDRVPRLALRGRRRQQHGVVVDIDDGRAGGLLSQQTGLESNHVLTEGAVVDHGLGELNVRSLHGDTPVLPPGAVGPRGDQDCIRRAPPGLSNHPVFDRDPRPSPEIGGSEDHYRGPSLRAVGVVSDAIRLLMVDHYSVGPGARERRRFRCRDGSEAALRGGEPLRHGQRRRPRRSISDRYRSMSVLAT